MPSELVASVWAIDPDGRAHGMADFEGEPGQMVVTWCGESCGDWPVRLGGDMTCPACLIACVVVE